MNGWPYESEVLISQVRREFALVSRMDESTLHQVRLNATLIREKWDWGCLTMFLWVPLRLVRLNTGSGALLPVR